MIRYVVAVLLATALFGVGLAAVEEVSVVRGETHVEDEIAVVEAAATSLLANDDPVPDGQEQPRRVVDLDLPAGGFATAGLERVTLDRIPGTNRTAARYRLDGRPAETVVIDAPLVNAAPRTATVTFGETTGSPTLVLELVTEEDDRVVQVTVR